MKIKRIINNQEIEIELTRAELENAFREEETYYHNEDLDLRIEEEFEYDSEKLTDDNRSKIINQFHDYLEDHDLYWDCYWSCMDAAIKKVLKLK